MEGHTTYAGLEKIKAGESPETKILLMRVVLLLVRSTKKWYHLYEGRGESLHCNLA